MAIHALWEDRYAFSIRKGGIDLLNEDSVSHTAIGASHKSDGTPTTHTQSNQQFGGAGHFFGGGGTDVGVCSGTDGTVIAQRNKVTTDAGSFIYGIPVTGNPDIVTGQEMIEIDVQDGSTLPRLSRGSEASNSGSTSAYRGVQTPTFSMDFIPTSKSLFQVGATFFQTGTKEYKAPQGTDPESYKYSTKQLTTPAEGDGSEPNYFATIVRQISTSGADSRLLSDAVCNSFSLSSDQSTPLTCSAGFTGRLMVSNYNTGTRSDDFTLDDGRNYLLRDCQCLITTPLKEVAFTAGTGTPVVGGKYKIGTATGVCVEILVAVSGSDGSKTGTLLLKETDGSFATQVQSGTGTLENFDTNTATFTATDGVAVGSIKEHFLMPIESFNIDATSDVSYSFYNERFPANMVVGGYSVEGSVTIPGGGFNDRHILRHLQEIFASAGSGQSTGSAVVLPIQVRFYWDSTVTGSLGDHIDLPAVPAQARDLHIRTNAMITDITTGGDNELTTTISFSCRNQYNATGTLTKKGIAIDVKDDLDDVDVKHGYDISETVLYVAQ